MNGHFSAEIREAHPDLTAVLKRHVARYSIRALGSPELAEGVSSDGDNFRFAVVGGAANYNAEGSGGNMTVWTVVELKKAGDERFEIVRIGTDTLKMEKGWRLLEISPERLHTGARKP